jgi:hypothetical protein
MILPAPDQWIFADEFFDSGADFVMSSNKPDPTSSATHATIIPKSSALNCRCEADAET